MRMLNYFGSKFISALADRDLAKEKTDPTVHNLTT